MDLFALNVFLGRYCMEGVFPVDKCHTCRYGVNGFNTVLVIRAVRFLEVVVYHRWLFTT